MGGIDDEEMYAVFNMGIGFALVVPEGSEEEWSDALKAKGERVIRLGSVEEGERGVVWAPGGERR